jgi:hypothetical protein
MSDETAMPETFDAADEAQQFVDSIGLTGGKVVSVVENDDTANRNALKIASDKALEEAEEAKRKFLDYAQQHPKESLDRVGLLEFENIELKAKIVAMRALFAEDEWNISELKYFLNRFQKRCDEAEEDIAEWRKLTHEYDSLLKVSEILESFSLESDVSIVHSLSSVSEAIDKGEKRSAYKEIIKVIFRLRKHVLDTGKIDNNTEGKRISEGLYRCQVRLWEEVGISEARKQQIAQLTYSDYLKTNEWRWIRERALVEYEHKCKLCDSVDRLEVHHKRYPPRGTEQSKDLIVLCHRCHSTHHGLFKEVT